MLRILFIGTDRFGIPALQKLLTDKEFRVVGIITQPDKPTGRKQIISPSDIKKFLLQNNYKTKIYQPEKLKIEAESILEETNPDLIVVAAYGQMIPDVMINYPKYKCLNIHGSLLPMYRGAVPIEMALVNGDKKTGVSILQMTPGLDDGPVLSEEEIEIKDEDDAISLREKLSEKGADLLLKILPNWINGKLEPISQDELAKNSNRELSLCKASDLNREKAEILPNESVQIAWNKVRAFANSSGAWTKVNHNHKPTELKILKAEVVSQDKQLYGWGKVKFVDGKLTLGFPDGKLNLLQVQLAGKQVGSGNDYKFLDNETNNQVRLLLQVGNEYLFMKREKFGEKYLTLPGGHIGKSEGNLQALKREMQEEIGIDIDTEKVILWFEVDNNHGGKIYYYHYELPIKPEVEIVGEELLRQNADNKYELGWFSKDDEEIKTLKPTELLDAFLKSK